MLKPAVKVCCFKSHSEELLLLNYGVDILEFFSDMPSDLGVAPIDDIAPIAQHFPSKMKSTLRTGALTVNSIFSQQALVNSWGIQMVDYLEMNQPRALQGLLSDVSLFQVVQVQETSSLQLVLKDSPGVVFLPLDSGKPNLKVKALNGTIQAYDKETSRKICKQSTRTGFLAGGVKTSNMLAVASAGCLHSIDLHSGLRSNDRQ